MSIMRLITLLRQLGTEENQFHDNSLQLKILYCTIVSELGLIIRLIINLITL